MTSVLPLLLLTALPFSPVDTQVELDGVVSFRRGSDPYYFVVDASGAAWRVAETNTSVAAQVGDRLHVTGTVLKNTDSRRVERARAVKTGAGRIPPVRAVRVEDLYEKALGTEDWFGQLVAVDGHVLDVNRRETYTQVLIGEKRRNVQVALPIRWNAPLAEGLVRGAIVRVQGVGVYNLVRSPKGGGSVGVENVSVLPLHLEDLQVIGRPPFWTPVKVLGVSGLVATLLFGVIAWLQRKRRLERVLADAVRRERLRLTGELHDNFQQLLAGSMFRLGAAMGKVGKDDVAALRQLELLRNSLNHTQSSLRAALWGLTEEAEGPAALTELFKYATSRMPQWEGKVKFTIRGKERAVARQCSGSLLLILQEAIGNALRHGGATLIDVVVHFGDGRLVVGIRDNGCGFDAKAEAPSGHLGLASMRQHAEGLGGTLVVRSAVGHGAAVVVRIPLRHPMG